MPEAVIVSTARSPIGRAFKGSLKDVRPDDLAATVDPRRAGQDPRARPARHRRPDARLRPARRRAGLQHGPRRRGAARLRLPARHHHHPLLLVVAADHPDGDARDQGRRGRRVHLRRRRDRQPLRQGQQRQPPGHHEPGLRRRAGPQRGPQGRRRRRPGTTPAPPARCPTSTSRWARPPRTWPLLKGVTREDMDEFGARSPEPRREGDRERLLRARDRPGHPARRHRGQHRRRPPRRGHRRGAWPASSRSSDRTAASPPATPARSTTAPPPWSS